MPYHEVNCDADMLDLTKHDIQIAVSMGKQIIWNHKGLRRLVPMPIVEYEIQLFEDYKSRLRVGDRVPERVGRVIWEQTVPVSEDAPRDRDQIDTKF